MQARLDRPPNQDPRSTHPPAPRPGTAMAQPRHSPRTGPATRTLNPKPAVPSRPRLVVSQPTSSAAPSSPRLPAGKDTRSTEHGE